MTDVWIIFRYGFIEVTLKKISDTLAYVARVLAEGAGRRPHSMHSEVLETSKHCYVIPLHFTRHTYFIANLTAFPRTGGC
jgi:hypothetical protein